MKRIAAIAVSGILISSTAGVSFADPEDVIEASQPSGLYGQNSQLQTDNGLSSGNFLVEPTSDIEGNEKAPVACAPTATINSFEFLQNKYGLTGLVGANPYDAINSLASSTYMNTQDAAPNAEPPPDWVGGGTSASSMVYGKEEYIQDHFTPQNGYGSIQTVGQSVFFSQAAGSLNANGGISQTGPTAAFIAQQLEDGEDIEAWESWSDADGNAVGGAHIITITGINFDPDENSGSLSFIDPYGGYGADSAVDVTSTTLTLEDGQLVVGYTGGGAGDDHDPDNPDDVGFARLDMVLAESPVVPEPATVGILGLGAIGLLTRRHRRARA